MFEVVEEGVNGCLVGVWCKGLPPRVDPKGSLHCFPSADLAGVLLGGGALSYVDWVLHWVLGCLPLQLEQTEVQQETEEIKTPGGKVPHSPTA